VRFLEEKIEKLHQPKESLTSWNTGNKASEKVIKQYGMGYQTPGNWGPTWGGYGNSRYFQLLATPGYRLYAPRFHV
jgi:hypothetical protein